MGLSPPSPLDETILIRYLSLVFEWRAYTNKLQYQAGFGNSYVFFIPTSSISTG